LQGNVIVDVFNELNTRNTPPGAVVSFHQVPSNANAESVIGILFNEETTAVNVTLEPEEEGFEDDVNPADVTVNGAALTV
jgi:hypothetical protein